MVKLIGIDDAGRGPVLGPMILAGVLTESEGERNIKNMGAVDSKLLTPKRRREIGQRIKSDYKYYIEVSSSKEIDDSSNLNYLEAIKTAKIINKFMEDLDEKVSAVVDCPSVNIQAWSEDVRKLIVKSELVRLSCEHKADANHPVVSAASIVAKEKREDEIRKLKMKFGVDFGSGYPADPKTKKFVLENFDNLKYKDSIRFSWKTVKRLVEKRKQGKLF